MIIETPFRRQITPSSYTKRARGTLPSYKHKLFNFVAFPEISINSVWKGASEIVATLSLDNATNIAFFDNIPSNPNYVAVISWKISEGVSQRYKLWEDVGEILYVDLYSGQTIGANAVIEIWNTPTSPTLITGFSLKTSILSIPDCSCEMTDRTTNAVYIQCTDVTLDLTGWNPSVGDYYLVIGCGVTELIHATRSAKLILKADDNTWHDLSLFNFGGAIMPLVDQAPTAAGTKDYFPLIGNDGLVYRLELLFSAGIYTYTIGPTVIDPLGVVNIQLLSTDGNYYLVSLDNTMTDIVINNNPIV